MPCLWVKKPNIVKMSILPKSIYKFNEISFEISAGFIAGISKVILTFIWKCKGHRLAKKHFEKEE